MQGMIATMRQARIGLPTFSKKDYQYRIIIIIMDSNSKI
jgi:hypothetical protein